MSTLCKTSDESGQSSTSAVNLQSLLTSKFFLRDKKKLKLKYIFFSSLAGLLIFSAKHCSRALLPGSGGEGVTQGQTVQQGFVEDPPGCWDSRAECRSSRTGEPVTVSRTRRPTRSVSTDRRVRVEVNPRDLSRISRTPGSAPARIFLTARFNCEPRRRK